MLGFIEEVDDTIVVSHASSFFSLCACSKTKTDNVGQL